MHTAAAAAVSLREDVARRDGFRRWRFRFACFQVVATYFLLVAGGMVTSMDAGLAVPDWPTSYGNLWFVPMAGNVFYEHGHRLVAQFVGLLTVVSTIWVWRTETRRRVRGLALAMLGAVLVQGALGGITVLYYLPPAVSVAHGAPAQSFFCLTLCLAYVLSREWQEGAARPDLPATRALRRGAFLLCGAVFVQLLLGAAIRHTGAALAIPDFPRMLGSWWPPLTDAKVAVHLGHRLFALVVVAGALVLLGTVARRFARERRLVWPAAALLALVAAQVALGAWTVLSRTHPRVATLHVVCGAAIFGLSVFVVLRSYRTVRR